MSSPAAGEADGRGTGSAVATYNSPAQGEADGGALVESLGVAGEVTVVWELAYGTVAATVSPIGSIAVTISS